MNYDFLRFGWARVLVVRPREGSYGHQVVEILMALHMARVRGATVCLRKPRRMANHALFQLECEQVSIVRPDALAALLVAAARVVRTVRHWRAGWLLARGWGRRKLLDLLSRAGRRIAWAARWKKAYKARLAAAGVAKSSTPKPAPPDFWGLDFRERYARERLAIRLHEPLARRAMADARRLGLAPAARIATLHVRESGFKVAEGIGESEADAIRNARIETYFTAIDYLVNRGFTVVRIGDPAMTPVSHEGVIDLATAPERSDALELWLMMQSELFIACDSGPYMASLLTPTPCLAVNVTNVIGAYPLRARDRYILKRVWDGALGRPLSLPEMLTEEYFRTRKDLARYRVIDNTAEEIRDAVAEMLEVLAGAVEETAPQCRYRQLAAAVQNAPAVAAKRVKKGEPAVQFLGDGCVSHFFASKYLDLGIFNEHGALMAGSGRNTTGPGGTP